MSQTWETLWVGVMHNQCGQATGDIRNPGSVSTGGFTDEDYREGEADPKAHTLHPMWAWWRGERRFCPQNRGCDGPVTWLLAVPLWARA